MAEAFLNTLSNGRFEAESAGIEPGILNPLAVEVMKEVGIDISQNKTKGVFEFVKRGICSTMLSQSAMMRALKDALSSWACQEASLELSGSLNL